jgi:hypothetical protein
MVPRDSAEDAANPGVDQEAVKKRKDTVKITLLRLWQDCII